MKVLVFGAGASAKAGYPTAKHLMLTIEKDATAYRLLIAQVGLDPSRTVMIGNSPRSDINPALKAGLCAAVYIPHPHTWELEHEQLDHADDRMLTLDGFQHLLQVF